MSDKQIKGWLEFERDFPLTSHRPSFEAGYSLAQQELAEAKKEIERLKGLLIQEHERDYLLYKSYLMTQQKSKEEILKEVKDRRDVVTHDDAAYAAMEAYASQTGCGRWVKERVKKEIDDLQGFTLSEFGLGCLQQAKEIMKWLDDSTPCTCQQLREALEYLISVKDFKDRFGKEDDWYKYNQPKAWEQAIAALSSVSDGKQKEEGK